MVAFYAYASECSSLATYFFTADYLLLFAN